MPIPDWVNDHRPQDPELDDDKLPEQLVIPYITVDGEERPAWVGEVGERTAERLEILLQAVADRNPTVTEVTFRHADGREYVENIATRRGP